MSQYLKVEDFKAITEALWNVCNYWYGIGQKLNINESELAAIKEKYEGEDCFTEMISLWLHQVDPKPTWSALVAALRSPLVRCKEAAEAIEKEFMVDQLLEDTSMAGEACDGDNVQSVPVRSSKSVAELSSAFASLTERAYKAILAGQNFTIPFLRSLFSNFPSTRLNEHQEFLEKYLLTHASADDIWSNFSSYWNFVNYSLLKLVIDGVEYRGIVEDMRSYDRDLNTFFDEVSLAEFSDYEPSYQPANSEELLVTFKGSGHKIKLAHIKVVEEAFAAAFKLPKVCGFFLKGVKSGKTAGWSIPSHYYKLLRWKLSICDDELFAKYSILSVSLKGEACYKRGSKRTPINPANEIALATNITSEVFEAKNMAEKVMASFPPFTFTQLCNAYICKLLTQYLSTHPVYDVCSIQISSFDDLPSDVAVKLIVLYQEACWYYTLFDYTGRYDRVDPLGLGTRDRRNEITFINYSVQEYLAAYRIVQDGAYISYSEQFSQLRSSLFSYFMAGIAGKDFNLSLFGEFSEDMSLHDNFVSFEASSPTLIAKTFQDAPPHCDYDYTPFYSYTDKSNTLTHRTNAFLYGYVVYFYFNSLKISSDILFEEFSRGVLAASEHVCDNTYPRDTLKLEMAVYCNTKDLKAFVAMPYSFLNRIEKLSLLKHSASHGKKEVTEEYQTAALTKSITNTLAYHSKNLVELSIVVFQNPMWDHAVFKGLRGDALRVLKIEGKVTYEFSSGLWEFLKGGSSRLAELEFESSGIGDRAALELASMLRVNTFLEKLVLLDNQGIVSTSSIEAIAKSLKDNNSLTSLCLQNCKILDLGAFELAKMLSTNQSLRSLSLHCNLVSDEGVSALSEALEANNTLVELNLSSNMLSTIPLASALKVNRTLQFLDLSNNSISFVIPLATSLEMNSTLKKLNLSGNELEDDSAQALADALSENKTLESLDCSQNQRLSFNCIDCFTRCLSHNEVLRVILPFETQTKVKVEQDPRISFA